MKAQKLMSILARKPLEYRVDRQNGSHKWLKSQNGYNDLEFAFHDGQTIPPGLVRKVLVKDVGLREDEAIGLL
jgi:predicted RNA binding protein YcfA (HicA-like mRNA interferase family)